jgi:hypothetical protein
VIPTLSFSRRTAALATVMLACAAPVHAQQSKGPKPLPAPGLLLAPISGQPIPILPILYIVADTGVPLPVGRNAQLAWADSTLSDELQSRGVDAHWLTPPEVRRVARRAPGMVTDPDHMGQAVMRFDNLKKVPDPLFSNIRSLVAMTNSRYVMIPAAMRFSRVAGKVHVELTLVLADARSGAISWRSNPVGDGDTPAAAVAQAILAILPDVR